MLCKSRCSNPPKFLRPARIALVAACFALPSTAFACTSCGCSLGTEFADQSYFTERGLRLDFRFDFVDQNQLRRGGSKVDKATLEFPNEDEIQQATLTRFYTLGADYSFNRDWGVNLQLPYLDREHTTIDAGETDIAASNTKGIGDLRVLGRWQGLFADRSTGFQLGFKLPTGKTKDTFISGPNDGETLDRGLQNGSGTTDVIVGVYNFGTLAGLFGESGRSFARFEQIQFKQAINHHAGFRPSTQTSLNLAVSYTALKILSPQLQLNGKFEGREVGAEADFDNSGSTTLYVSPGVTAKLFNALSAYSFVQLPVYQHYNGYQLAPHYLLSIGLRYAL